VSRSLQTNRTACRVLLYLSVAVATSLSSAKLLCQDTAPTPETVEEVLHQMADQAGVIFAGQVTAIRSRPGENGASGTVEVDFRVDEAIRGCQAGSTYTLREWAGLWSGGDPRYRAGQHLLMMLHAPGAAGISSPVGGMAGVIPLRGTATSPTVGSSSTISTAEIADLRWVGTRLLRTLSAPAAPVVTGSSQSGIGNSASADASTAAQQAPVSVVVQMLRSWQQDGRQQDGR
jgi:hypothetical protein